MSFLSVLKAGVFPSAQAGLETALLAGLPHRGMGPRQRLWMSPPHPGHATGNSSPTRAMSLAFGVARCRGNAVCRMSRSGRRWYLRPPLLVVVHETTRSYP